MGDIASCSFWKTRLKNHPAAFLLAAGGLSLVLYIVLAVRYPLGSSLADPRATWVTLIGESSSGFAIHLLIYLCLTLLYAVTLNLLSSQKTARTAENHDLPVNRRWIFGIIIASWLTFSMVMMTSASSGESHDIFDYVFRGRMMVESNANPLVEVPRSYRTNAFIRFVAWQKNVDTYGPLWEITSFGVSSAVHQLAEISNLEISGLPSCPKSPASCRLLITYLTSYRLLAVILSGFAAALITSMVNRIQPQLAPAALAAWLWNPLALISTAVGGHNDLLMIVLVLVGLWLMQRQQPIIALLALILAAHVKLIALIWMPLLALWSVRRWGLRRASIFITSSTVVGLFISWLLYFPFDGWGSLPRMLHERTQYLSNSVWQAAYTYLYKQQGWDKEHALRLTAELPTWVFIAIAILLSLWMLNFRPKRWQRSSDPLSMDDRRLWTSMTWISLLYLVLGAFWFQHWYILWVLAPAALIPGSNFTRNVLPYLSLGALSANFAQGFLFQKVPKGYPRTGVYLLNSAIIWMPALLAGIIASLVSRLKSQKQTS
jgi:hypothetical protein